VTETTYYYYNTIIFTEIYFLKENFEYNIKYVILILIITQTIF